MSIREELKKPIKTGCYACIHLEWGFGDVNDPEGWTCLKRQYKTHEEENRHLRQMESESYLNRKKSCQEVQ